MMKSTNVLADAAGGAMPLDSPAEASALFTGGTMEKTQALAVRDVAHDMPLAQLGSVMATSGFFKDSRSASQAIVKIIAGREMGIGAVTAMTGIHIIEGKVAIGAGLLAAAIKRSGRYNYKVLELTDAVASVEIYENGQPAGKSTFTMKDAAAAKIDGKQVWKNYPKNMLFARAISNAVRWYCPDVTGGPMYTPEELGAEVNADGDAINVQVVEPQKLEAQQASASKPSERPAPAPHQAAQDVLPDGNIGQQEGEQEGVVESVDKKDGGTEEKPWTKYGVKINGKYYGTFDHSDGLNAYEWIGERVYFRSKPSKNPKHTDLVSIRRVDLPAAEPCDDAPGFNFGTDDPLA